MSGAPAGSSKRSPRFAVPRATWMRAFPTSNAILRWRALPFRLNQECLAGGCSRAWERRAGGRGSHPRSRPPQRAPMGGATRPRRRRDRHRGPDRRSHRVAGRNPPAAPGRGDVSRHRHFRRQHRHPGRHRLRTADRGRNQRPARGVDHAAPAGRVRAGRERGGIGVARDADGDALSRCAADRSPESAVARPCRGRGVGDLRPAARRARRGVPPDIRRDRRAARRRAARGAGACPGQGRRPSPAQGSWMAPGVAGGLACSGDRAAADQRVDVLASHERRAPAEPGGGAADGAGSSWRHPRVVPG